MEYETHMKYQTINIHNQTLQKSILRFFCVWNRELIIPAGRIFQSNFFFLLIGAQTDRVKNYLTQSLFALTLYANKVTPASSRIITAGSSSFLVECLPCLLCACYPRRMHLPSVCKTEYLRLSSGSVYLPLPPCHSIPVKNPADSYSRAIARVTYNLPTTPFCFKL